MKKKLSVIVTVLMSFCLLVQTISFADSTDYSDLARDLVESLNRDITRDDVVAIYGTPYSETEYVQFWDSEQKIERRFYFKNGRCSSASVTYGEFEAKYRGWMYNMYKSTYDKICDILGDGARGLTFNDGSGIATDQDVACAANAWSGDGFIVLLVYGQASGGLRITMKLAFIE